MSGVHSSMAIFRKSNASKVILSHRRPSRRASRTAKRTIDHSEEWEDCDDETKITQAAGEHEAPEEEVLNAKEQPQLQGLMRLPLELREQVYDHVMGGLPTEAFICAESHRPALAYLPTGTLPSLALASHQMYHEVAIAFLRRTALTVDSRNFLQQGRYFDFLNQFLDEQAFRSIRSLDYEQIMNSSCRPRSHGRGKFHCSQIAGVVMRCKGLQQLHLRINAVCIVVRNRPYRTGRASSDITPRYLRIKTPAELDQDFGLSYMADHKGSFTFRLGVRLTRHVAQDLKITTVELLEPFVQAFEGLLKQRGSNIRLELVEE
jgi:hypothetical protein